MKLYIIGLQNLFCFLLQYIKYKIFKTFTLWTLLKNSYGRHRKEAI